jgi:antitoxin FitA
MSAIQVRDVPPDLLRRLRERAASDRLSLSDYVLKLLERDAGPSTREWLATLAEREPVPDVDVAGALDGSRADRDSRAARVLRH